MEGNTFYDSPNDFRNYLAHHGIKNQKWGVRHGPPYPLGSGTSARIKKGIKVAAKKGSEVYNKSVKPRAQAIAKKGAAVYNTKMPEGGKKVINAAAKKTKEVYEVNKAMAKNAVSNYKKNYEATHKTLRDEGKIAGKPGAKSKPQPRKEDIDVSTLPAWEQKYVKKAYRVYNPEGFTDGTVQTHKERKSHTSDIWDLDNGIDDIIVDRAIWHSDNMTDAKTKERFNRLNSLAMNDKQASKLQTSVFKNNSKIKSEVINSMSNAIFEEGWSGANNASEIKDALSNSEFGVVTRAFAYHSTPESKYPGYISMSVSASAERYVGDHIFCRLLHVQICVVHI